MKIAAHPEYIFSRKLYTFLRRHTFPNPALNRSTYSVDTGGK